MFRVCALTGHSADGQNERERPNANIVCLHDVIVVIRRRHFAESALPYWLEYADDMQFAGTSSWRFCEIVLRLPAAVIDLICIIVVLVSPSGLGMISL
jgi:hypothetical protein